LAVAQEGFTEEERQRVDELKALFRIDAEEFGHLVLERKRNHLNFGFSEAEWDTLFDYEQAYLDHVIEVGVLVRSFGLKAKAAGMIVDDVLADFLASMFKTVIDKVPRRREPLPFMGGHEKLNVAQSDWISDVVEELVSKATDASLGIYHAKVARLSELEER
jgi:hypothetical protein